MKTRIADLYSEKSDFGRMISGPLLTIIAIAIIEILSHVAFKIPNPPAIILLVVVFSVFYGGFPSGFASAVLGWFYLAVFFSIPGEPFHYVTGNLARVIIWGITIPIMVVLVGVLKQRAERAVSLAETNTSLNEIKQYTENVIASLPAGLVVVDQALKVFSCNRTFRVLFGLGNDDNIAGRPIEEWLPLAGLQEQALEILTKGTTVQGLEVNLNSRHLRLAITGIRIMDEDRLLMMVEDVSEEERLREQAHVNEVRYRDLVEGLDAIVWEADAATFAFTFVSRRAEAILGYPVERWCTEPGFWASLIHPQDREQAVAFCKASTAQGHDHTFEYRTVAADGRIVWLSDIVRVVRDEQGRGQHLRGVMVDITEHKTDEARIERLAFYDPLTGLPNRALCLDRLKRALFAVQRQGNALAVMFIDLDLFKHINDSLGHTTGDQLLQEAATRLSSSVRGNDMVARLGGDEFVVIMEDTMEDAIIMLAQKLLGALRQPFAIGGRMLRVSCSIGIALYPRDGNDAQTLLRNADSAMYRAKEQGRDTWRFYTEEMNRKALERLALEEDMYQALALNQFLLHYQPQVNLRTGEITGMEALARWQHPQKGLIPADRFIPVAEETGLILPLGEWVLREACIQAKAWERTSTRPVRVAVNLSARQFRQADLVDKVAGILRETGLNPSSLELEITESMIMDQVAEAVATLSRLNTLGIRLAIDDFGMGYSSLSYLKRFPVHVLKIDKSFIAGIPSDSNDTTIVSTIISMAHDMRLRVVAEGVESEAQLAFLRQRGCDEMQGYYFSRPMAAQEATFLLREGRRLALG